MEKVKRFILFIRAPPRYVSAKNSLKILGIKIYLLKQNAFTGKPFSLASEASHTKLSYPGYPSALLHIIIDILLLKVSFIINKKNRCVEFMVKAECYILINIR